MAARIAGESSAVPLAVATMLVPGIKTLMLHQFVRVCRWLFVANDQSMTR